MNLVEFVLVLCLPEFFVHIVEGAEGKVTLDGLDADAFTLIISKGYPFNITTFAHALGLDVLLGHAVDSAIPYAHECRGLAVRIVLVRTTPEPLHVAEARLKGCDET